jgi:hypothetical protein
MNRLAVGGRSPQRQLAAQLAVALTLTCAAPHSRPASAQSDQFGGQARADAAQQMVVLAVQQAISSLPPTSGQAFTYEFDAEKDTYVRGKVLGPTAFRSARTIGKGKLALRGAVSYFELSESFGPIQYLVQFDEPFTEGDIAGLQPAGVAGFGLDVSAKVTLLNLSATYGITNRIEVMLNLPITVVDAKASQPFSTPRNLLNVPLDESFVAGAFQLNPLSSNPQQRATQIAGLRQEFGRRINPACTPDPQEPERCLSYRNQSFTALGFDFNDGTHAGVGRISLGGKAMLYSAEWIRLAFMTELFFPSPNEEQFAGPNSGAILPRAIAGVPIADWLEAHVDVGYDYDFNDAELRRFVWNVGASVPGSRVTVDFGLGGSEYDEPISWTPSVAYGRPEGEFPPTTITALENNQLGTTVVSFLGGIKVRLADQVVLSGAVTVPVIDESFQPAALGTLALEVYL